MANYVRRFVHRLEQLPRAQELDPRMLMHDELMDDERNEFVDVDYGYENKLFNPACDLAGIDARVLETYV